LKATAASLEPLRRPGYRLLWLSSTVWWFARWIDILITGWATLQLTNSAWDVALIGFYRNIPVPLFGAFTGAIADRLDRRLLVIAAQTTNALVGLTVGLLLFSGRLAFWHLAVANILLGLAYAIDFPSRRSIVPDLVGREFLVPAMVLESICMNVSRVVGPLLAGAVLATLSLPSCFLLLAGTYAVGILPLLAMRLPFRGTAKAAPMRRFIAEGLSFCRKYEPVRGVLLITLLMNCFAFPYQQLLSVFARDILQVGPMGFGLLGAGDGIGSLLGATALMSSGRLRRQGWVFVLGSLGVCAAVIVFAFSPFYALSVLALIAAGVGHSGFSTLQSTIILQIVGDAMRGRVMGILTLAIGMATPGMLIMGSIAGALGAPWAVGLSTAAGGLLVAATAAASPKLLALGAKSERAPTAAPSP